MPFSCEAVLEEAKVRVVQGGGDPTDDLLLASQSAIQFGQYRGRTFKWLLENDLGYSLVVLSGHQREREAGRLDRGALMANKDAFLQYACTFKKVTEAIRVRRQREGTLPGCEGDSGGLWGTQEELLQKSSMRLRTGRGKGNMLLSLL